EGTRSTGLEDDADRGAERGADDERAAPRATNNRIEEVRRSISLFVRVDLHRKRSETDDESLRAGREHALSRCLSNVVLVGDLEGTNEPIERRPRSIVRMDHDACSQLLQTPKSSWTCPVSRKKVQQMHPFDISTSFSLV